LAEDELQNVEMAEEERRRKNQDLKSKKRDYKGYDDDEFVPGSEGMKRAVLAKYDEDAEGTTETVSCPALVLDKHVECFAGIPFGQLYYSQGQTSGSEGAGGGIC
jgi:hypothetical protein